MEARAAAHSAQPGCGLRTKQVLRRKVWRASCGHTLWAPFSTSHTGLTSSSQVRNPRASCLFSTSDQTRDAAVSVLLSNIWKSAVVVLNITMPGLGGGTWGIDTTGV